MKPIERSIRMDAELWFRDWSVNYEGFPEDYFVLDVEATGSQERDLIIEIGWCEVAGGKAVDNRGVLLDWTRSPLVDPNWVRRRMEYTAKDMAKAGLHYPWSFEDLKRGSNPVHVLAGFAEKLADIRARDGLLVAHNGIGFDLPMLTNHFKRFLKIYHVFRPEEVWDTGALEKAVQLDELLCPGEQPGDFAFRVLECPYNRNVNWSLHRHVIPKYDLEARYNLKTSSAHTAPFDAYVTHLLFEEFRAFSRRGLERQPA